MCLRTVSRNKRAESSLYKDFNIFTHPTVVLYNCILFPGIIAEGNKNIHLSNTSTITVFFRSVKQEIPNISSHRCTVRDQESKINNEQLFEITQQAETERFRF